MSEEVAGMVAVVTGGSTGIGFGTAERLVAEGAKVVIADVDESRGEAAALARDIKEQARRNADKEARRIIAMATQRLGAEHTAETTVAAVALPNDEMKGRIIGREGRNIRALETATGVDLLSTSQITQSAPALDIGLDIDPTTR